MIVTIQTSGDAEEIVELLGQVHEEHRQRRPQSFKPFDRTAALEGQRVLLSRAGAQMFVARVQGVCVGYALVCERVREENAFRYTSPLARRVELNLYSDNDDARRLHEAQGFVRSRTSWSRVSGQEPRPLDLR